MALGAAALSRVGPRRAAPGLPCSRTEAWPDPSAADAVTRWPLPHQEPMTQTRRVSFDGSGPFVQTLVAALEGEGVAVAVRREGRYVGEHGEPRRMGDAVKATLVVTGSIDAIKAGVSTFRDRFASRAVVTIDDEPTPPDHGRR
jgi:hypothetical protein